MTMKEMDEEQKALLRQKKIDYDKVFRTPEGQRVLKDLMEKCQFFEELDQFNQGSETIFKAEGRRMIFIYILQQLTMRPIQTIGFLDPQLEFEDNHIE